MSVDLTEAHRAGLDAAETVRPALFAVGDIAANAATRAVTAAAPLIEAAVREQVAREIEAQRRPITVHIDYPDVAWDSAQRSSARIARGADR